MKRITFLFFALFLISCSKVSVTLPPTAEILLGTNEDQMFGRIVAEGFVPFKNQDTIRFSELSTANVLVATIIEKNLDSSYFMGTQRIPIFNLQVTTSTDNEYYVSGQNCFLGGYGGGGDNSNDFHYFQGTIEFPFLITKSAKTNNDTLELRNDNDYIIVSYLSKYTKVFERDSTLIIKDH